MDARLCKRRELLGVSGGDLLSVLLFCAPVSCWGTKCSGAAQKRRCERASARATNALHLSDASYENRLIVFRNIIFTDSENLFVFGTSVQKNFSVLDVFP